MKKEAKPADTIQVGNKVFEFKHTAVNKDIHMFIGSSDSSVRSHDPKLCPECVEPGSLSEATALSDQVEYTCPECGSVKLLPKEQVQQWKEEITYED